MKAFVRIKSQPKGEAPSEIRDAWVGCVLPAEERSSEGGLGVLSMQPKNWKGGYVVDFREALEILGSKSEVARTWWEEVQPPISKLYFDEDCCEVIPD